MKIKMPEGWRGKDDAPCAIGSADGTQRVQIADHGAVYVQGMNKEILLIADSVFLKQPIFDAVVYVAARKAEADAASPANDLRAIAEAIALLVQDILNDEPDRTTCNGERGYFLTSDDMRQMRGLVGAWERACAAEAAAEEEG